MESKLNNKFSFSEKVKVSDNMKILLKKMIQSDPSKRITWKELYDHKILKMREQENISFENPPNINISHTV